MPVFDQWMARGTTDGVHYGEVRVLPPDEAKFLVKRNGVVAAFYKITLTGAGKTRKTSEEYIAYMTLGELKKLLTVMEPLAGPSDDPLPPPITGPEFESFKIQDGPNV